MTNLLSSISKNISGTTSDVSFHQLILQATNNLMFVETFKHYHQPFERVIYAARVNSGITSEDMQTAYDEHVKILQGICEKDQIFAAEAMSAHLRNAKQRLLDSAQKNI